MAPVPSQLCPALLLLFLAVKREEERHWLGTPDRVRAAFTRLAVQKAAAVCPALWLAAHTVSIERISWGTEL